MTRRDETSFEAREDAATGRDERSADAPRAVAPVSYTHLTLPTILLV